MLNILTAISSLFLSYSKYSPISHSLKATYAINFRSLKTELKYFQHYLQLLKYASVIEKEKSFPNLNQQTRPKNFAIAILPD